MTNEVNLYDKDGNILPIDDDQVCVNLPNGTRVSLHTKLTELDNASGELDSKLQIVQVLPANPSYYGYTVTSEDTYFRNKTDANFGFIKNGAKVQYDGEVHIKSNSNKINYRTFNGYLRITDGVGRVDFDKDYNIDDVSADDVEGIFASSDLVATLHSRFNSLVSAYPTYISKVDVASELNIEYPRYCNGISEGDAEYLPTPSYKVYGYKVSVNTDANSLENYYEKKYRILLVGAMHGNETTSSVNLYVFVKHLLQDAFANPNRFKMLSCCDFYIVPSLNSYGSYHNMRENANGVNINRNFGTGSWKKDGEGTSDYSGETPDSEFETKIFEGLVNTYKPHIVFDHHNYSVLKQQFYMTTPSVIMEKIAYNTLLDISFAFKKKYPQYFGTNIDVIYHNIYVNTPMGSSAEWLSQKGVPIGSTMEVSQCINFVNGQYDTSRTDNQGSTTASINEYTLRNTLIHSIEHLDKYLWKLYK